MKGDYTQEFRTACANIYANLANKRKTFCVDPKNKTKPNFAWNCPQYTDEAKSAAASAAASAEAEAATAASQKAATDAEIQKRAASNAEDAAMGRNFSTKMAEYRTKLDKFESMTQQELETLINEINDYWKKSLLARADSEDEKRYRRLFPVFNTEFKTKFPTLTVLLNTK